MVKRALNRKLIRDIWRNRAQFVAMILLCALGTWCFAGLDSFWRMLDTSANTYFQQQTLADFWAYMTPVDREAMAKIKNIPGVQDVQARASLEFTVDLPHEPTLQVHAFDGAPRINVPLMQSGRALASEELRSCLLEDQFAKANGFSLGDRIPLRVNGALLQFTVVGTCISPEHVITAKDVRSDPHAYGFMICSSAAFSQFPLNEALVTLAPGADRDTVQSAIKALYPQALLVNRVGHGSTQKIQSDAEMFRNLSYLFPLLAFSVAALIVLTTLTRMIENQRIQIGTLKSLGYRDGVVRRHYLCYALYPSLFGALIGLFTGRATLPYFLWEAESDSFVLPACIQAPISPEQWFITGVAVVLAILICLRTYNKNAHEWPAALLRPKPPKAGKKLLLERMPALWNRLGFNGKMIIRNLFRNKLRTFMSFVGTLCCTMLLITSMGLQDSIHFFVGNYYTRTLRYNVRADLTTDAGLPEAYHKRMDAQRVETVMEKSMTISSDTASRTTLLTVLEKDQELLYLGKNESYFAVPGTGVTLTRKLTDVLKVGLGDTVRIHLPGKDDPIATQVTGICDVNIGQGVYMTKESWESWREGPFLPTSLLLRDPTPETLRKLESMDEVDSLKFPASQGSQMLTLLQSMMGMFMLLSLVALGLAFVVQYNMGILNFMERYREYATLKVLGYHQKEIRSLMTWENNLVMLMAVLGGVVPGRFFTALILKTCEGDNTVFASTVNLPSYLISCAIAIVFSMFVTWILTRKVKTIDMVEALKSVE